MVAPLKSTLDAAPTAMSPPRFNVPVVLTSIVPRATLSPISPLKVTVASRTSIVNNCTPEVVPSTRPLKVTAPLATATVPAWVSIVVVPALDRIILPLVVTAPPTPSVAPTWVPPVVVIFSARVAVPLAVIITAPPAPPTPASAFVPAAVITPLTAISFADTKVTEPAARPIPAVTAPPLVVIEVTEISPVVEVSDTLAPAVSLPPVVLITAAVTSVPLAVRPKPAAPVMVASKSTVPAVLSTMDAAVVRATVPSKSILLVVVIVVPAKVALLFTSRLWPVTLPVIVIASPALVRSISPPASISPVMAMLVAAAVTLTAPVVANVVPALKAKVVQLVTSNEAILASVRVIPAPPATRVRSLAPARGPRVMVLSPEVMVTSASRVVSPTPSSSILPSVVIAPFK